MAHGFIAFLNEVHAAVRTLAGADDRPVVVFSSAWPFLKEMRQGDAAAVEALLDALLDALRGRSVLMPSFTNGFTDGVCDLDHESGYTGVLGEAFRRRSDSRRTLSAFFSFVAAGEATGEVADLAPAHAWGEGSLYDWMERRDVVFLMFGTDPTHCSYLHRLEWLCRDVVDYRFDKTFSGRVIRGGKTMALTETLYVRKLDPPIVNDFTVLAPHLTEAGMRSQSVNGVSLASYGAQSALAHILPIIRADPLLIVKDGHKLLGKMNA